MFVTIAAATRCTYHFFVLTWIHQTVCYITVSSVCGCLWHKTVFVVDILSNIKKAWHFCFKNSNCWSSYSKFWPANVQVIPIVFPISFHAPFMVRHLPKIENQSNKTSLRSKMGMISWSEDRIEAKKSLRTEKVSRQIGWCFKCKWGNSIKEMEGKR